MFDLRPPDPGADPGYIESLSAGTRLADVRRLGLLAVAAPVALFVVVPLLVSDGGTAAWTLVLPTLAAVASFVVLRRGLAGSVAALPPGTEPSEARASSLETLRRVVRERLLVTGAPLLVGLLTALAGDSVLPYAVSFLLAWPQMLWMLPHPSTVADVHARLEAAGTYSYLDEALREPSGRLATD
jgi:hypothetical protein